MDGYAQLNHLVVHGVKEGMACSVRSVAGSPFGSSTEISCGDKAFFLFEFHLLVFFPAFKIGGLPGYNPVPWNSIKGHFSHRFRGGFHKKPGYFLIAAPVRTFDRVLKMNIRRITVSHDTVA